MLNHCNKNFKPYDIWFMDDLKIFDKNKNFLYSFVDRRLLLGRCPKCNKNVALLIETKFFKNRKLETYYDCIIGKQKISSLCEKLKHQVKYTAQEAKCAKGKPYGWIFGHNVEIHKKGKIVKIRQYAKDWHGKTELRAEKEVK